MSKERLIAQIAMAYGTGCCKRSCSPSDMEDWTCKCDRDILSAVDTYAQEIAVVFAEHLINMMKIQCTTEHMTDLFQQFLTNKNEKK